MSLKQNHFLSLKPSWKYPQGKEFAANPRYKHSLQDKQRKLFHHKSVRHQNSPFGPLQRPGSPALAISLPFPQEGTDIWSLESHKLKCGRGTDIQSGSVLSICLHFFNINHKLPMHGSLQCKGTQ